MLEDETATIPGAARGCSASILVLGYNSLRHIDKCLGAIAAATQSHSVEILFLNNGNDASEDFVAERYPHVRILPSQGNVGFAEANNRLARHARGKWMILLNPDTEVYPGAIDALIGTGEANPDYWLLAGIVVDRAGQFETKAYPELPTMKALLRGLVGKAGRPFVFDTARAIQDVEVVHGGFLLVTRQRWEVLGGLDETFFLYGEDIDLCKRVLDIGGKIGIVPASKVFHDLGSGNASSLTRNRFIAIGNAHFLHRHHGPLHASLAIATLWLGYLARFTVGARFSPLKRKYGALSRGCALPALKPWVWVRGFASPGADPRRDPRPD